MPTAFDPEALEKSRRLFFPIIAEGIVTGYNVYRHRPETNAPFIVNYLHSDLSFDKTGKPLPHLEELTDKLSKFGPAQIIEKITNSIVDRIAVYKVGDWEENPAGLTFYDQNGKVLSAEDLKKHRGLIVVEGKQYDLGIELSHQTDVDKVLRLLRESVFRYEIDDDGNVKNLNDKPVINRNAISGSWDIPLITLSSRENSKKRGFRPVEEITVTELDHVIATLIDKNAERLRTSLQSQNVAFKRQEKLANSAFIDLYLNTT